MGGKENISEAWKDGLGRKVFYTGAYATRKVYSSGACSLLGTCYSKLVGLKPAEAAPKAFFPMHHKKWLGTTESIVRQQKQESRNCCKFKGENKWGTRPEKS